MKSKCVPAALCAAALALALSGCASRYVEPEQYSGFLQDYSALKPGKSASGAPVMYWLQPGIDVNGYTSVYLEPSRLYPQPPASEKIPQDTLQGITRYYDQALQREFAKVLPLASAPGPHTLVVRPAITSVSAATKDLRPYEYLPLMFVAAQVSSATGIRDQETRLASEAAFLDGGSRQTVAEVVRKGTGKDLENDSQAMQAKDAQAVLDGWAADMTRSLQLLRQR